MEEIAKFRAARRMWAEIMKNRYELTNEKAMMCRFHTQTGGSTLTSEQVDNNVVRTAIQALSAVLGGTQSLHTNSRDEALSLPTDESANLALRTQQIIAHETNIPNYPDPFGGSYVVEELTEDLVAKTYKLIDEIDLMGGAIVALENGWIENEISKSAYEYQKDIDEKKQIIVGLNKYINKEPEIVDTFDIDQDSTNKQITSLKTYKENRDNESVKNRLKELKTLAQSDNNIIPGLIKCVHSACTLGEMSDVLREVYGDHTQ